MNKFLLALDSLLTQRFSEPFPPQCPPLADSRRSPHSNSSLTLGMLRGKKIFVYPVVKSEGFILSGPVWIKSFFKKSGRGGGAEKIGWWACPPNFLELNSVLWKIMFQCSFYPIFTPTSFQKFLSFCGVMFIVMSFIINKFERSMDSCWINLALIVGFNTIRQIIGYANINKIFALNNIDIPHKKLGG